ncbi:hypothetical protein MTR67_002475 [Solanum verrucosum]|uniref:Uncharacterized protein n=1 Tax=Solanum verrucosum TaxID=315347 RepID=A0AAF0PTQ7_SOLVR|nr:hypothetical protein MTR67_002475 [Solanum verrucosum]
MPSFLRSFQPFHSFLRRNVHALLKTSNTSNLRVFIRYQDKNKHLRTQFLLKYTPG